MGERIFFVLTEQTAWVDTKQIYRNSSFVNGFD